MVEIVLIHAQGPDRDALAAFLAKGASVAVLDEHEWTDARSSTPRPAPGTALLVVQESLFDPALVSDDTPVVILGTRRALPTLSNLRRVADPYFLEDVQEAVRRAVPVAVAEGAREAVARPVEGARAVESVHPASAEVLPGTQLAIGSVPGFVRGVSHALNNPLAAALGWLQLLGSDLGETDPRHRAFRQVRAELRRLERLVAALGHLGHRGSALETPLDLEALLRDRVRELEREGLRAEFVVEGPLPPFVGDQGMTAIFLDLLFASFVEERSRVRDLALRLSASSGVHRLTVLESGGVFSPAQAAPELSDVLLAAKGSRGFAVALCRRLARDRRTDAVAFEQAGDGARSGIVFRLWSYGSGSP